MLPTGKPTYWRHVQPVGALADFRAVWRATGARRWPFVALAFTATLSVFSMIMQESWRGPPPKPKIVYINSWTANRTDAEIAASNLANQKVQERLAQLQSKRDEKVKEIYRTLGRASGMDVDAIERKARADDAAEKAAEARAIGLKASAQQAGAVAPADLPAPPEKPAIVQP
jgi:hypothetical protein